ncbi:thiol reductant ABC exporter subunit CydD [Segnochrobactraceae bacterium EtOH-i3]
MSDAVTSALHPSGSLALPGPAGLRRMRARSSKVSSGSAVDADSAPLPTIRTAMTAPSPSDAIHPGDARPSAAADTARASRLASDPTAASDAPVSAAPRVSAAGPSASTRRRRRPSSGLARLGGLLQALAALVWLPQAALVALGVARMAAGAGVAEVVLPAAGILALGVVRTALDAAGQRLSFKAARQAVSDLRTRAVTAFATRSPLDRDRPASGLAASLMAEQAEAVLPFQARFQPVQMRLMLVPLAILACILPYSWVAAVILMVAAPLIPIFMALVGWQAKAASEAQMVEIGTMNAFLIDRLRGLATLRSLGAIDATALRLRANALSLKTRTMAVLRIAFLSSAVLELFSALGVAMVAVYIGFHLLGQIPFGAWGAKLTLGEGLFILLLAPAFFEPLRDLSAVWHDRAAGAAALSAFDQLEADTGPALPDALTTVPVPGETAPPAVRLDAVRFTYPGTGRAAIDGLSLTVAPGERVALWGPSGAGKSTLLALMAGLALADDGTIRIGDVTLGTDTAATARRRVAFIGQKPHLFSGSLAANVGLGRTDIDPVRIGEALRQAAFDPDGRRRIGEGGAGISGGEALRVAIARAAADRHADLILADEPTAHLDADTAAAVIDGLLAIAPGRTLIVATHDPVLAARLDRVIPVGDATFGEDC